MPEFEIPHAESISVNFRELTSIFEEGSGRPFANSISETTGIDPEKFKFDNEDGWYIENDNGEKAYLSDMSEGDKVKAGLNKLFGGDSQIVKNIQDRLKISGDKKLLPTKEEAASAEKKTNSISEKTINYLFEKDPITGETRFDTIAKTGLKGVLLGLTYQALSDMATANNGCWIYDIKSGNLIVRVSSRTDAGACVCNNSNVTTSCKNECNALGQGNWNGCLTADPSSCNCVDKNNKPLLPGYGIKIVNKSVWSMLASVASTVGSYVKEVTDAAINFASDVGNALKNWWIWLIVAGVVAIVVVVVAVSVTQVKKHRTKGQNSTAELKKLEGGDIWKFYSY